MGMGSGIGVGMRRMEVGERSRMKRKNERVGAGFNWIVVHSLLYTLQPQYHESVCVGFPVDMCLWCEIEKSNPGISTHMEVQKLSQLILSPTALVLQPLPYKPRPSPTTLVLQTNPSPTTLALQTKA